MVKASTSPRFLAKHPSLRSSPRNRMSTTPPKVKVCGHEGCLLATTKSCCGCEDKRSMRVTYTYYQDGKGVIKDSSKYARYWDYCPTCKHQLMNLRSGRKRCACGLVSCDLTTEKCCICLDKRTKGAACYKYVDGKGLVLLDGGEWIHYCPACQERSKPKEPDKEPEPPGAPQDDEKPSQPCKQSLPDKDITPAEKTHTAVSATTVCITKATQSTAASETPQLNKLEPTEDSSADCDDLADYELIHHVDVPPDEVSGEKSLPKKTNRSWWGFTRSR